MAVTVGIPRGMLYHKYSQIWKSFFEELGAELIPSKPTNRQILSAGVEACVGEACLPLKAFFGHLLALRGGADLLFVPRYRSVSRREYLCPKIGGLPDLARTVPDLPELLSPEINCHDHADGSRRAAIAAAARLGVDARRAVAAHDRALRGYLTHRAGQAVPFRPDAPRPEGGRILLLGHPYLIEDSYLNMDTVRRLQTMGAEVVTMHRYDGRTLRQAASALQKPMFWQYGSEVMGCAELLARQADVDGVLYLTCFGCGIDSFAAYMAQRRFRESGLPFALLTLDEHTAPAGLETRLEAFWDTVRWRRGA